MRLVGTDSTPSLKSSIKNGTRWNASLPTRQVGTDSTPSLILLLKMGTRWNVSFLARLFRLGLFCSVVFKVW
jgi:hypothetical protein